MTSVAAVADCGSLKELRAKPVLRLRVQAPALPEFGSQQIEITTPSLFVVTQQHYAVRVSP